MVVNLDERYKQLLLSFICCSIISAAWYLVPHPLIIIIVACLPIAFVVVLFTPFQMSLLFLIFSFFRIHEAFPALYSLKLPLLLSLASLSSLIWHLWLTRKFTMWWSKEIKVLTIFFIIACVGVLFSINKTIAIPYFKDTYIKIILMSYAIIFVTREVKDFSLASVSITIAGSLIGLVTLKNQMLGIDLIEETRVKIGDEVLGDPNDLSFILMFPVSFSISLIMTPNIGWKKRILGLISFPILFAAVLATQSRGGLLGIMTVVGIYAYRGMKSKLLFCIVGGSAAAILYVAAGISGRKSGGADTEGLDASAEGRLHAWGAAWNMALAHPITGVGLNNFLTNYWYFSDFWDGRNHAVHSTWFGVLAETGFVGLVIFIWLIYLIMKLAYQTLHQVERAVKVPPEILACSQALFIGLAGILVAGTFLTQGFSWPIYVLTSLILALSYWVKKNLEIT